jgi:hypothetical protein
MVVNQYSGGLRSAERDEERPRDPARRGRRIRSAIAGRLVRDLAFFIQSLTEAAKMVPSILSGAKKPRYLDLLRLSYPIRPELFDRLSKDWASLEKFQRARGVLRFMANVVDVLLRAQTRPLDSAGPRARVP